MEIRYNSCPKCGGDVQSDLACHTWPREVEGGRIQWMACMPCDSATRWACISHSDEYCWEDCWSDGFHDGCGWRWTDGLNPGNPRAEENEKNRPDWSKDEG